MGHYRYLMTKPPMSAKDMVLTAISYFKTQGGLPLTTKFTERAPGVTHGGPSTIFTLEITSAVAIVKVEHIDMFWQDRNWIGPPPSHDPLAVEDPDQKKYLDARKADIEDMLYNKFLFESVLHGMNRLVGVEAVTSGGQVKQIKEFFI